MYGERSARLKPKGLKPPRLHPKTWAFAILPELLKRNQTHNRGKKLLGTRRLSVADSPQVIATRHVRPSFHNQIETTSMDYESSSPDPCAAVGLLCASPGCGTCSRSGGLWSGGHDSRKKFNR